MTCWLGVSNGQNARVILQQNVWGVPMRFFNWIVRTEIGDTLLVCVDNQTTGTTASQPAVTACFEIVSGVYRDTKRIFPGPAKFGDGIMPYRVSVRPLEVFNPPISLRPLVPKLGFIPDKQQWSYHLRSQVMREIPEEDYLTIVDTGRREVPSPPVA